MEQTIGQIESHIEKTREDLGANLHELEHKVKQLGDWHHHFSNHPMTLLGVAFGGGVLLATLFETGRRARTSATSYDPSPRKHKALDTWDHIKDALIGVAATRVTDFVGELVPGFKEQFVNKTNREKPGSSNEFLT